MKGWVAVGVSVEVLGWVLLVWELAVRDTRLGRWYRCRRGLRTPVGKDLALWWRVEESSGASVPGNVIVRLFASARRRRTGRIGRLERLVEQEHLDRREQGRLRAEKDDRLRNDVYQLDRRTAAEIEAVRLPSWRQWASAVLIATGIVITIMGALELP